MIAVDASVWVRALLDTSPAGAAARGLLRDDPDWLLPAHAPDEWLLTEIWRYRHNLGAYDAPYVALAARHEIPLITFDGRLANAAKSVGVRVVIPD